MEACSSKTAIVAKCTRRNIELIKEHLWRLRLLRVDVQQLFQLLFVECFRHNVELGSLLLHEEFILWPQLFMIHFDAFNIAGISSGRFISGTTIECRLFDGALVFRGASNEHGIITDVVSGWLWLRDDDCLYAGRKVAQSSPERCKWLVLMFSTTISSLLRHV